jgi:hypothetical protein
VNYIFRLPRFPVIFDSGQVLFPAKSKAQLERGIEKLGIRDEKKRDIIDSSGEGFAYYPKIEAITPSIGIRKWKKLQLIDLYDSRRPPEKPSMRRTSLGSRTLEDIVCEIVELMQQSQRIK